MIFVSESAWRLFVRAQLCGDAQVVREQKLREKEAKEAELRDLAVQARLRGAGGAVTSAVPVAARGEG